MIGGANENCGAVKPANFKKTTNRRALKDIKNCVGEANKRQLKEVTCGNNHNIVPGRQVTTQFASISANKSQQSHEETIENEKHNKPIIIDVNKPMAQESEAIVVEDLDTYDYMSNQLDINEKMRAILIDWLIEVHYKFKLREETLHLTVNIIDRFLSRQSVVRKKLQLVGVTALLLACKYEEVSVPAVDELVYVSDGAYTREEVLDMEKLVLKTLRFNISVQTPFVFVRRFLKAAEADKKLELLSSFIIELCLVEYQMLKFQPSLLAAATMYTAQCSLKGFKCWTKTCQQHTMYGEDQLLECSKMMVDLQRNAASGKLTGVHRKYSTLKFGFVAKSEPALFLLDTRV